MFNPKARYSSQTPTSIHQRCEGFSGTAFFEMARPLFSGFRSRTGSWQIGVHDSYLEPVQFEGVTRHQLNTGLGHDDLLFELDTFAPTFRTDERLHTECHAGFQNRVVSCSGKVDPVFDTRVLIGQAHTMNQRGIAIRQILFGNLPATL